MNAYKRIFEDTAARVVRREANDVMAQARKMLARRGMEDFRQWLATFFSQHADFTKRAFQAVLMAYAELVAQEAAGETGADLEQFREKLERFVFSYANSMAVGLARKREKEILAVLEAAQAGDSDPLEELQAEMDAWEAKAPEAIARKETVESNNAVAKFVYSVAGVTVIRSVASGESCPYCTSSGWAGDRDRAKFHHGRPGIPAGRG